MATGTVRRGPGAGREVRCGRPCAGGPEVSAALRVLVPTDGSDPACRATQHVLDLAARGLSLEVHLLNVRPAVRGIAASLVSTSDLEGYHREEGMNGVGAIAAAGQAGRLEASRACLRGRSGEMILAFARKFGANICVRQQRPRAHFRNCCSDLPHDPSSPGREVPVTLVR